MVQHGDQDVLNTAQSWTADPTTGAVIEGLAPGVSTLATVYVNSHSYGFGPDPGDYPGTDPIYVGNTQTFYHDGSSQQLGRMNGPQVIVMDDSARVPPGRAIEQARSEPRATGTSGC